MDIGVNDTMIDAIRSHFGDAGIKYVANKHQGGKNGNKGIRYEDYFIGTKIVEAAVRLVDDWNAENPHIQGQYFCFVDDVRIQTKTKTSYYQIKNALNVSWDSLKDDFKKQYELSTKLTEPDPITNIIVSCDNLADKLKKSIPEGIKKHSFVYYFPWHGSVNKLVLEDKCIQGELSKLAYIEQPTLDILIGVFHALIAGFNNYPCGASVKEILQDVRKMYPCQLRLFPSTLDFKKEQLKPQFQSTLDRIQGLTYSIERGGFHWFGFGMSGFFGTDHKSKSQFEKLQNQIIEKEPKEFDEFEKILNDIQYGEELP